MRQLTNRNFALLASLILWAGLGTVAQGAGMFAATASDEWKSKLTAEERSAISKPEGANDRVKTYVRLAESRLKSARSYLDREDYTGADEQIMGYVVLIADVGAFTKASVPKRDKAHKTLEVSLREQLRSLEGIRRDTAGAYADTAEKALKLVTQVRRQALNLLLGDGFLTETDK